MRAFIKKYSVFIIFLGVELSFFFTTENGDGFNYELFFMGWGFVWLMFLLFSLVGGGINGTLRGMGAISNVDSINYTTLSGQMSEHLYKDRQPKKHNVFTSLQFINLVYLIMFILNVIGYIIIFVVKY